MSIIHTTARAALGCAAVLLSSSAFALTLTGTTVKYTINDPLGYFGSASVVGDSLEFTPSGFMANSLNPFAGQQVNVIVEALDPLNYQLASFSLSESGSYSSYVDDPVTGVNGLISGSFNAIDSEGNTSNQIDVPIGISGLANGTGTWTGSAAIALPASGWGGVDGIVGKVELQLINDLVAYDTAEIWKNMARITVITTPVPEAETYAMMLAGLGLVAFMARRRNRAAV